MAVIEVNHKILRNVAAEINTYCTSQDREMRLADNNIKSMLLVDWVGDDAMEFRNKWEDIDSSDSTAVKFRESLKKFGEGLEACANEYQTAQEDSYSEADRLPKYLYW